MDENKIPEGITNEETVSETTVMQAEAPEAAFAGGGGPEIPAKKFPLIPVLAVIGVAIIAVVAAFMSGMFDDPEKAVMKAITATVAQQEKQNDKIIAEVPAMKAMYGNFGSSKPTTSNFHLTFDSVSMNGSDPQMAMTSAMVNQMLSGSGIRGDFVKDPANSVAELNAAVHIGDVDLIGGYAYISPETIGFNVPAFSDTVLSINPKTFAQDAKASALFDYMGLDNATVDEIQAAFDLQDGSIKDVLSLDYKQMTKDMYDVMGKSLVGSTYAKGAKVDGMRTYTVSIPGANVKALVVDLMKYVYLDSPFASFYKSLFTPMLAGEMSYEAFITATFISPIQLNMPEMDATILFKVGSGNLIKGADITLKTSTAAPDAPVKVGDLLITYKTGDDGDVMTANVDITDAAGVTTKAVADMSAVYKDGSYDILLKVGAEGGEFDKSNITEAIKFTKDGVVSAKIDVTMPIPMYGVEAESEMLAYTMNFEGTIKENGDTTTYDFQKIGYDMNMAGEQVSFNLKAGAEVKPVASPYKMEKTPNPLFAMSVAEFEAEMAKYGEGMSMVQNQLFGILMGGAMSGGTPEAPAA